MLVEQVEALKSIQDAYVAMNSGQLDEGFDHPNHKKLDANGNGKVDAQDFAMLRAKKKGIKNFKEFKEEVEQLDELSKKTLGSYIKHANIDSNDRAQFIGTEPGALKAIRKREKGISTAVNKLTKEDIEGLDEAHKIGNKVTIHKGTGAGITGHIGEISRKFKGDTDPTYTIFHGDNQAVTVSKKQIKAVKEEVEQLGEGTNIPVSRATDAVSKVMGQKGAVNFLAKLKPGNNTHTSWNEVNSALVDQGAQSAHIAKVAGHLKPTQYNEAED